MKTFIKARTAWDMDGISEYDETGQFYLYEIPSDEEIELDTETLTWNRLR